MIKYMKVLLVIKVLNGAILVKKIGFGKTDNHSSTGVVFKDDYYKPLQDRFKASD